MFSWKKKNYREPPLENIQQAYQGFNSCKRTLACLPFAQPVRCFWHHWSCFLPCHFVSLFALIHFFEVGRSLCSSYSNIQRVSTSSGWDPASFSLPTYSLKVVIHLYCATGHDLPFYSVFVCNEASCHFSHPASCVFMSYCGHCCDCSVDLSAEHLSPEVNSH